MGVRIVRTMTNEDSGPGSIPRVVAQVGSEAGVPPPSAALPLHETPLQNKHPPKCRPAREGGAPPRPPPHLQFYI